MRCEFCGEERKVTIHRRKGAGMKLKPICYECALPHMESRTIVHTMRPESGNCHRCKRSKEAIEAGSEFGVIVIDALQRVGLPSEDRPAFYATEIGVQLGNIAADIGVDATLVIMDTLREQVAMLPVNSALKEAQ